MRPSDLPADPERYAHGSRARYVLGCRCGPCRAANVRAYHARQARAKALAREIVAAPAPVPQLWTARDGTKRIRWYKRACPGVNGQPCRSCRHLRKDSTAGVCGDCRLRLVWNGLVPADAMRRHLRKLSRQGVGYKSVAIAADVSRTVLAAVLNGRKRRVRAQTERRVVSIDRAALADHALVSAGPTLSRLARLLDEGFSKAELARRLGYRQPALQIRGPRILAKTALKVERFYRRVMEV